MNRSRVSMMILGCICCATLTQQVWGQGRGSKSSICASASHPSPHAHGRRGQPGFSFGVPNDVWRNIHV